MRAARTVPEAETGANLVRQVVASGTLHMRSHVDIDNQLGLSNLHEILKVRERFRDLVTIQIVAFPQSGILRSPGTRPAAGRRHRRGRRPCGRPRSRRHRRRSRRPSRCDLRHRRTPRRGCRHPSARQRRERHRPADGDRAPHRGGRPERQGGGEPRLRAGLRADRPGRAHRRPSGRSRRRHHEPRPGRCGDAAAQTAARPRRRSVRRLRQYPRCLVAVRQRRHAGTRHDDRLPRQFPPRRGAGAGLRHGDRGCGARARHHCLTASSRAPRPISWSSKRARSPRRSPRGPGANW